MNWKEERREAASKYEDDEISRMTPSSEFNIEIAFEFGAEWAKSWLKQGLAEGKELDDLLSEVEE